MVPIISKLYKVQKKHGWGGVIKRSAKTGLEFLKGNCSLGDIFSLEHNELGGYKDILFINGCDLSHPSRYRVSHQIEQLHFYGFSCDTVFYTNVHEHYAKYYRAFIFFRCPWTEKIDGLIERIKRDNKIAVFDIDDLVIDGKYVAEIETINHMSPHDFGIYMDGVNRIKKTMLKCDCAITTTDGLANELGNYFDEVLVNKNVASEEMVSLSKVALMNKQKNKQKITIGYFSGSITHNSDINLIAAVLVKVLQKYKNVELLIVGFLDLPSPLKEMESQIRIQKFTSWKNLPSLLATIDINIVPLVDNVFNNAKSENKWTEAALVKVPTIASAVGPFKKIIHDRVNGLLAIDETSWYDSIIELINNDGLRISIGEQAHLVVLKEYVTAYTGKTLNDFIRSKLTENIVFLLPSLDISGGVNVVIKHASILKKKGFDVSLFSYEGTENICTKDCELNVINITKTPIHAYLDKAISTLWSTNEFLDVYPKIGRKYYLVQNFETDFYEFGNSFRILANSTYNCQSGKKYLTISRWCQTWLKEKFNKDSRYLMNGLDLDLFRFVNRRFEEKIIILIEGNSEDYYKNVDESFLITNRLDKTKFEVWYLSYRGLPKDWYNVDKFFHKIKHEEVGDIYEKAHILLKSSILESFSYPPLEMMATGGVVVVCENDGNAEYLINNKNCLLYNRGDLDQAVELIEKILIDKKLRDTLIKNGRITATSRSWDAIQESIIEGYTV